MTPEPGLRISRPFQAALECDPAGRGALLDRLCGDDVELRAEVEKLLAAERSGPPRPIPEAPRLGKT